MTHIYLGVDLGTTNTKVISVDAEGRHIATASKPTDWIVKPNGRIETIAEDIFNRIVSCIDDLLVETKKLVPRRKSSWYGNYRNG